MQTSDLDGSCACWNQSRIWGKSNGIKQSQSSHPKPTDILKAVLGSRHTLYFSRNSHKTGKRTKYSHKLLRFLLLCLLKVPVQFSSVQSLSRVRLFVTPWTAARQASLSITNSRNPPKPMSIESVMPSSHLILCRPLLFLPSIFPSIRVFSNESVLHIRWPKY